MAALTDGIRICARWALVAAAAVLVLASAAGSGRAEAAVTSYLSPGFDNVFVGSDAASDAVVVTCTGGTIRVNGGQVSGGTSCGSVRLVGVNMGAGNDSVDTTGVSAAAGFTNLRGTTGGPGDLGVSIAGEAGADVLRDGPARASIDGGTGSDLAFGGDGPDDLLGSHLEVFSGTLSLDSDELHGEGGDDLIHGSNAADFLFGEDGSDRIYGNLGNDLIRAGSGPDRSDGGKGADDVFGQRGRDLLRGAKGPDELRGGRGRDTAHGDQGNDLCRAERELDCEH